MINCWGLVSFSFVLWLFIIVGDWHEKAGWRGFFKIFLAGLAILWLMLNKSRVWDDGHFPWVLSVFADEPKKFAEKLMGDIAKELKSREVFVEGLR